MLRQTAAMAADVTRWYDEFEFHRIYQRVLNFCVVDLSAFYFDVLKDRLYTSAPNSQARRSAQTAIWRIWKPLVRLLAPIMSFTCDEVWGICPRWPSRPASVHMALFPKPEEILGSCKVRRRSQATRRLDDPAFRARAGSERSGRARATPS